MSILRNSVYKISIRQGAPVKTVRRLPVQYLNGEKRGIHQSVARVALQTI